MGAAREGENHPETWAESDSQAVDPQPSELERLLPHRSPRFIHAFSRVFWPFARIWFRAEVTGFERLPRGPVLLVGNHSGAGFGELAVMLAAWWRHFGNRRIGVALAHAVGFLPGLRQLVEASGGLPATRENGRAALAAGLDLLVFPGGDLDVLRPFTRREHVIFGGRHGFIRLAEERGVPLVPVVTAGSHAQFLFLPGGETIARGLGLDRLIRLKTLPLWPALLLFLAVVGLAALDVCSWGWVPAAFLVAFFPNPARIRIQFCEPIDVTELLHRSGGDRARAAEHVRTLLERELQRLSHRAA